MSFLQQCDIGMSFHTGVRYWNEFCHCRLTSAPSWSFIGESFAGVIGLTERKQKQVRWQNRTVDQKRKKRVKDAESKRKKRICIKEATQRVQGPDLHKISLMLSAKQATQRSKKRNRDKLRLRIKRANTAGFGPIQLGPDWERLRAIARRNYPSPRTIPYT